MRDQRDDCCAADPRIARHFDGDMRRHAEAGTFPEMVAVSQGLLELLSDVAEERPTLLELGCGSGALTVELVKRGAIAADGVDLSSGSIELAQRRAAEAGVAERTRFQVGDGAQVSVEPHDWVVMDRVICCYRHVDRLLENATSAAQNRVIFSVPQQWGWRGIVNRLIVTVENATNRFRGRPCPGYVHSIPNIERRLTDAGFRRVRSETFGLWYAAVFERS